MQKTKSGSAKNLFGPMLNWKLKIGSHVFPGPDGGTCLNEAAIVAAGLEYQAVDCAEDCPSCFSRPIAAFALSLNDAMTSRYRQKLLMPFVLRLANTVDCADVEFKREKYIVENIMRGIVGLPNYQYGDDYMMMLRERIPPAIRVVLWQEAPDVCDLLTGHKVRVCQRAWAQPGFSDVLHSCAA